MKIAKIVPASLVNGDGIRLVLFFQGCSLNCPGCFSKELQEFNGGKEYSAERLAEIVTYGYRQSDNFLNGITVTGGNPPEQPDMAMFLHLLRTYIGLDLNIAMWTGFTWEEMKEKHKDILSEIDFIVTDRFDLEKKCEGEYYGSSNQRIFKKTNKRWKQYGRVHSDNKHNLS